MAEEISQLSAAFVETFQQQHSVYTSSSPSQEAIDQITARIIELSNQPLSIAACIHILRDVEDETIRFYTIVNIHRAFASKWSVFEEDMRMEYLNQFYNLLAQEPSERVSAQIALRISKIINANSNFYPTLINYARQTLETGVKEKIKYTMQILIDTADLTEDEKSPQLSEFFNTYATTVFGFDDLDMTLSAFDMIFKYYDASQAEKNEGLEQIWNHCVEVLTAIYGDENHTKELANILYDPLWLGADYTDIEGLLPIVLELFNRADTTPDLARSYMILFDALFHGYDEWMKDQECLLDLYNRYCLVAAQSFSGEHLNDTEFDIFSDIVPCMALNPALVAQVWGGKEELVQSPEGIASVLLFLSYSFKNARDFYEDNLDDVIDFVIETLADENVLIIDCGLEVLNSFCQTFPEYLNDYLELFIAPLFQFFDAEPTSQVINILITLFESAVDTDPIFDDAIQSLFGKLEDVDDENIQEQIIRAIAALAKNSTEKVAEHAGEVFSAIQDITTAEPDSGAYGLRGSAVEVICSLLFKCPSFFKDSALEIAGFLIQCMQDEDVTLITDALNAYGTMVTMMHQTIQDSIESALEILPQLAEKDMTKVITDLTTSLLDTAISGGDDIQEEADADKGIILQEDYLEVPGAACMLYATILSLFPQLVADHLPVIIQIISHLADSVIECSVSFAIRSCTYVFEALQAAEAFDEGVLGQLEAIIQHVIETETSERLVADAIQALAALLSCIGLEHLGEYPSTILDILGSVCILNLPCFNGNTSLPTDFYKPVGQLFREVFHAFGQEPPAQVVTLMNDVIMPMIGEESDSEKAFFAMSVLAKWVENAPGSIPEEQMAAIIQLIIPYQTNHVGYQGFYLLKTIAQNAPGAIAPFVEPLFELFKARIEQPQKKSEAFVKMMDNMVSCIGQIAINVLQDSFPADFIEPCLQLMPARLDLDEDISIFQFFFFIAEKYHEPAPLASVIIRLFTISPEMKYATQLSDDVFEKLKQTLATLLRNIGDAQSFITEVCNSDEAKIQHVTAWLQ